MLPRYAAFICSTLVLISCCKAAVNELRISAKRTPFPTLTGDRNFTKQAQKHGYYAEEHKVITEDGYILTIFRLIQYEKCQGKMKKYPVLVVHGLLQSADGFLDAGPNMGPGFILADGCYDMWFGNVRGNYNSRDHVSLNSDTDVEFWRFSVDEIGLYDIPAKIDYVLKTTGAEKLNYIGYSQGGGTCFIMCSEKPEYRSKINLFVGLAPATRHLNAESVAFRLLSEIANILRKDFEAIGYWEILSKGFPLQGSLSQLCQITDLAKGFCSGLLDSIDGAHPGSVAVSTVKTLIHHTPAGTSIQNFARYGQAFNSERFVKFDYGSKENMKRYGTKHPPEYNLTAVTMPVLVFQGQNDKIVSMKDAIWTIEQFPNVVEFVKIKDPLWNHLDMGYSRFAKQTVFDKILKYFNMFEER